MTRIILQPGEVQVGTEPDVVLSTLLGSCVAACLFDPVARVFGMNHFLLASRSPHKHLNLNSAQGRYGLYAMELLVNALLAQGAHRRRLQAKVFGGANVLYSPPNSMFAIGDMNALFVQEYLKREGIPLMASDLGGQRGRQIHFYGQDFAVDVRLLGKRNVTQVTQGEQRYLRRALEEQQRLEQNSRITFL